MLLNRNADTRAFLCRIKSNKMLLVKLMRHKTCESSTLICLFMCTLQGERHEASGLKRSARTIGRNLKLSKFIRFEWNNCAKELCDCNQGGFTTFFIVRSQSPTAVAFKRNRFPQATKISVIRSYNKSQSHMRARYSFCQ